MGRDDKLKELHELLQQENKAAICAVSGMGGIGKTELAVQYALQYQEEYTGGICWLQVRGADIGTQIVNYGRAYLGLTPPDDQELMVQLGYCWSNWGQGNTLIVFDDVDDYKAINNYSNQE
ncbi:NB-ARC domain-containing protein [Crocosphaera sp. Alani8]|uniref:NB-ARC domain-containing protein n=1 Tax=Crocosphaera sp. Alani8 TaxID=3038952 RepID=UPI00313DD640